MPKTYEIHLTEEQAVVVIKTLEEYVRLRLGQNSDLAKDVAGMFVDFTEQNPNQKSDFDKYQMRRNYAKTAYDTAYQIATDYGLDRGYHISGWTDDSKVAYDMWYVLQKSVYDANNVSKDYQGVIANALRKRSDLPLIKVITH